MTTRFWTWYAAAIAFWLGFIWLSAEMLLEATR